MTLKEILEITAITAGIMGVIFAGIGLLFNYHALREETKSDRPYFVISNPGIKQLEIGNSWRMMITLQNEGGRVASNFSGKIIFTDQKLKTLLLQVIKFSIGNEIPLKSPTPWYLDEIKLPQNLEPQYIIMAINYCDPILKESFSQKFFMKWDGVQNGVFYPDFTHASLEETQKINDYLNKLKQM